MAEQTAIAWTDHTANFWMGCEKVSPGCAHCYAETLTENRMGISVWGKDGTRQPVQGVWSNVAKWHKAAALERTAHRVFCMSLGDFFEDHPVANDIRPKVFELIRATPMLDWQILTKRPENLPRMLPADWSLPRYPNVWLGTSIENDRHVHRADALREVPAVVHFISAEPLLGPLPSLNLDHIEWVIVGGESGPGYRPMDHEWARQLRNRCLAEHRAFFFKQSAAYRTEMGIRLDGVIARDYPRAR
jgi:protein gp37